MESRSVRSNRLSSISLQPDYPLTSDVSSIHLSSVDGANGYLIDQFNQDTCNNRTDDYGGSVENRARFVQEIVAAITGAIGQEKTALRLSPWSKFQDMQMRNPLEVSLFPFQLFCSWAEEAILIRFDGRVVLRVPVS
jgi:hypothetical protein